MLAAVSNRQANTSVIPEGRRRLRDEVVQPPLRQSSDGSPVHFEITNDRRPPFVSAKQFVDGFPSASSVKSVHATALRRNAVAHPSVSRTKINQISNIH